MKKDEAIYLILALFGFLFIALGVMFLFMGTLLGYPNGLYVGIGLILSAIVFFVLLVVVFGINYYKGKK